MYIKYFRISVFLILSVVISSCAADYVKPEILKTYPATRVLEMGIKKYSQYDYDGAIYYYKQTISLFPDNVQTATWANYEIGFIYYEKGDYKKALEYFGKVLAYDNPPLAAKILAIKISKKIENKTRKHEKK